MHSLAPIPTIFNSGNPVNQKRKVLQRPGNWDRNYFRPIVSEKASLVQQKQKIHGNWLRFTSQLLEDLLHLQHGSQYTGVSFMDSLRLKPEFSPLFSPCLPLVFV